MGLTWEFTGGSTDLDEDEKLGLRADWITTRAQLDELEHHNIELGRQWAFARTRKPADLLTDTFVKRLHKEMYNEVWKWLGSTAGPRRTLAWTRCASLRTSGSCSMMHASGWSTPRTRPMRSPAV